MDTAQSLQGSSARDESSQVSWDAFTTYSAALTPVSGHESTSFGLLPTSQSSVPSDGFFPTPSTSSHFSQTLPAAATMATQWPSMLINTSSQATPSLPTSSLQYLASSSSLVTPKSLPPLSTPSTVTGTPGASRSKNSPKSGSGNSRRLLTDDDRRQMCEYHEANPDVKQTEIGAMFGVERSTVSKVLRQKDKYLDREDRRESPLPRNKGKQPDIERALAMWARKQQRQGQTPDDNTIRKQAQFFSNSVGDSEKPVDIHSKAWLEKFKQKYHLLGARDRRGRTIPADDDSPMMDSADSGAQSSAAEVSPISTNGTPAATLASSPPYLSSVGQTTTSESMPSITALEHKLSQSLTSTTSGFSDVSNAPTSFPPHGPESTLYSSPMVGVDAAFVPSQHGPMPPPTAPFARPDYARLLSGARAVVEDESNPANLQNVLVSTGMESFSSRPLSMASTEFSYASPGSSAPSPAIGGGSSYSLAPDTYAWGPPVNSSAETFAPQPTQDEARQALELVMSFFENQPSGMVDPQEYITMGKLMQKLKFQGSAGELPGGMHSIDLSPKMVSRKRSVHSL